MATAREILNTPSLLPFLASKQQNTLVGLSKRVRHPASALLYNYVEEGILAHTAPPWSPLALETTISEGPHASDYTPEMTTCIQEEMQRRIKYGCSILLPAADTIQLLGRCL